MKKNILYIFLTLAVLFSAVLPAAAAELSLVYDEADLLTEEEETSLETKLESIGSAYGMDIVVAAVNSLNGYTPMAYADDFFDYNGYGQGDTRDGLILVVAMETSDWWISTSGRAITVFTDAGIDYIGEQIVPWMSEGDFAAAFGAFADLCDSFLTQAASGDPYDIQNLPKVPFEAGAALLLSLCVGVVIALIYTGVLKGQLHTVRPNERASAYVKSGSLQVQESRDLYLYHNVTRTERQTSSSGGGSSTHRSSSGRTHGGGGGKF